MAPLIGFSVCPSRCMEVRTELPRLYHLPTRFLLAGRVLSAAPAGAESRKDAFVATLMDAGVEFTAVDNPHANKLTVHILAAVAA